MDAGRFTGASQVSGGRYGAIWRARDIAGDQEVALKQLALVRVEDWPRVEFEAAAAAALAHPHLASALPPVEHEQNLWLVEEWVEGIGLSALLPPAGPLTVGQSLGLLRGVLAGLAHAHAHGVVHGTVSPRTVIVTLDGAPKLVEFAARFGQPDAAGIGPFASPEAFAGADLTPAADVYSVAALIAHVLAGPDGHRREAEERLSRDLSPVLDRALSPDPAQRHRDAQELLDDLERAAERGSMAAWWTTEGVGAVVASTASATAASSASVGGGVGVLTGSTAAQAPGGVGALSGSISRHGSGALPGSAGASAGHGALAGSARAGRRLGSKGLIAAGSVAAVLTVFAVAGVAATRSRGPFVGQPGTGTTSVAAQATKAPTTAPTLASPTPTPTPSPTPSPNGAEGFAGVYRYEAVITKSTVASQPVGTRETATWQATTTCKGEKCVTSVTTGTKEKQTLKSGDGNWNVKTNSKGNCINLVTGKRTGQQVATRYTRNLKPVKSEAGQILKITGSDRFRQLKKCANQRAANVDVAKKITITFVRS